MFSANLLDQTINTFSQAENAAADDYPDATIQYGKAITEVSSVGGANIGVGYVLARAYDALNADALSYPTEAVAEISASQPEYIFLSAPMVSASSGYSVGGWDGSTNLKNVVHKLAFSSESWSTPSATLSQQKAGLAGACSSTKGYAAGGETAVSNLSQISTLTFSSETTSNLSATLNTARTEPSGVYSSTKGYFGGGRSFDYSSWSGEIDGVQFSDDTAVNPTAALALARSVASGIFSSTNGYWCGGYKSASPFYSDEIDGIVFSSEAATNPSSTLSVVKGQAAGLADSLNGYSAGGEDNTANVSSIDKFVYSSTTVSTLSATVTSFNVTSVGLSHVAASPDGATESADGTVGGNTGNASESVSAGDSQDASQTVDIAQGATASSSATVESYVASSTITEVASAVDTKATDLTVPGTAVASAVDAADASARTDVLESAAGAGGKGYFAGGVVFGGGNISDINRLTFSTHVAAVLSATLATARKNSGACASSANGYWVGGFTTTYSAEIDGIRFYDESARNPSMSISTTTDLAGTESLVKGYIAGGNDGIAVSAVRTINFFPESSGSIGSALSVGKFDLAAMASPSGAYFSGGKSGATYYDAIHGMPFSSETVSTLSAVLGATKSRHAGMASPLCGYFTGGSNDGSPTTAIDRITFSSEARATLGATLSVARIQHAGCTSLERGYSAGGYDGGTFYSYAIESLIFSSETVATTSAVLGNGSDGTVDLAGTQNRGGAVDYATGEWAPSAQSEAASAADANSVALSTPADIAESASATSSQSVLAAFASAVTEAASATSAHPVLMTAVSAISEAASSVDVAAALAVFVVSSSDSASGTDAPVAIATLVSSGQDAATASDTSDGTPTSGTNSAAEVASAAASADVQAAFVSAIGEAASATSVNTGGFAVARSESSSATDAPAAGAAYPMAQADAASPTDSPAAGLSMPVDANAAASSASDQSATQGFVVADTEAGSAADSHNASYGAQNVDATGSATATASTDSTPGVWIAEQASPSTSDAVVQARYTGISAAAAATAEALCTGPVLVSSAELASAVDAPVGRPAWPVARTDAASATASQVSEFAFFVTESGSAASDAAGVAEKDAVGVAQASAVDLPAVVRMAFADGYSIAYPVEVHDATLYFTLVSQAVEAVSGSAAAGAVVTTGAHGAESATPGAEQQAIKLASAGVIEGAIATDVALGGMVFSGYVLALAGAADYSDAFILDMLPPSIGTAVKIIRQGNTAYVVMAVEQRFISTDRSDRAILYPADAARMVDVVSHERHVDETQLVRDILLPDDQRDILSGE
jgi:trimeric autotransporter adhesin